MPRPFQDSRSLFQRARHLTPGGVNSPVRSFRGVGGEPVFIARGNGSHIWDVDGNEYIDYVCSWGPLILGHAHPEMVEAVKRAAESGTSFGAPTPGEVELAQLIDSAFPSIELVRLVNSGTEACMSAIRLARAYTGRNKIIKFSGCYHGHADSLLVKAGSGAATLGVPDSAGVPSSFASETLVAEYNDIASVDHLFEKHGREIACVIVEPVAANMGVIPPREGFLQGLRDITMDSGSLLIFDEVITGFRVAYGGAQALYGITPDITCLGKIIGGGLPVGAYGGRKNVMEMVAPLGPMYQAGTLSGNPIAVAAGVATIKTLKRPGVYQRIETLSAKLADGLQGAIQRREVPAVINRVGSLLTLFFAPGSVESWEDVAKTDAKRYARFFHEMLGRGVYLPPSPYEAWFLSLAHTKEDVDRTLEAASGSLEASWVH